jgi:hypothetical protein
MVACLYNNILLVIQKKQRRWCVSQNLLSSIGVVVLMVCFQYKMKKLGKGQRMDPQWQQQQWFAVYYQQLNPQQLEQLQQWFAAVDKDRSGTIHPIELQTTVVRQNGAWFQLVRKHWQRRSWQFPGNLSLPLEMCIKLVRIFDVDLNGTLTFFEYASMYRFIEVVQMGFYASDRDRSGLLDPMELQNALNQAGLNVTEAVSVSVFHTCVLAIHVYLGCASVHSAIATPKRDAGTKCYVLNCDCC